MQLDVKQLVELTIKNSGGYEDFPFNGGKSHEKIIWHTIRHHENKKIIAMAFIKDNTLWLNLKLTAEHVEQTTHFKGVERGYHMNKKYWVSVNINNTDLSQDELINMIKESAELTSK